MELIKTFCGVELKSLLKSKTATSIKGEKYLVWQLKEVLVPSL
jgi:hypothetical protein